MLLCDLWFILSMSRIHDNTRRFQRMWWNFAFCFVHVSDIGRQSSDTDSGVLRDSLVCRRDNVRINLKRFHMCITSKIANTTEMPEENAENLNVNLWVKRWKANIESFKINIELVCRFLSRVKNDEGTGNVKSSRK